MKKKLILGGIVGALLLWLSLRHVEYADLVSQLTRMRYVYAIPALILLFIMQYFRSFRWGLLIRPVERINQLRLFSITSVGFFFIMAVPARIGELVRPYLLARRTSVSMSFALASVIVERLFDVASILMLLIVVSWFMELPPWMTKAGTLFFSVVLFLVGGLLLLAFKRKWFVRIVSAVTGRLSQKHASRIARWSYQFVEGLTVIADPVLFITIAVLSLLIWVIGGGAVYCLFFAAGFDLSIVAAFAVMVIVIAGISIPTAPGFVGNWHFYCVMALSLFGMSKTDAMSFAVVHHFLSISVPVILGMIFLPSNLAFLPALGKVTASGKDCEGN